MKQQNPLDNDCEEVQAPAAILEGIQFSISNDPDREKISVLTIESTSEVTDPRLGLPNPISQCLTCGSNNTKSCEGHFGVIKFLQTIIHPYFLSEVAKLLNKVCPGCKYIRQEQWFKAVDSPSRERHKRCRYCLANTWYPPMTFRVSSKDVFRRTAIVVEVSEKGLNKLRTRGKVALPADYWEFIPKDSNIDETSLKPTRRVLSHAQVYSLISGIDPRFIRKFIPMFDSLYLRYFPVTPNGHRVTELIHSFNGQRLVFDERTRIYKKLVDFRGNGNELSSRVMECLQISKLYSETTSSSQESLNPYRKKNDTPKMCGLRFMKDVILGKRNNHSFRTVVVGDPNLKLYEIGIPRHIAERLQVSESLNNWNWERLIPCCDLRLIEKGEVHVRRGETLVGIMSIDELEVGDNIFRPLTDGDIVLMNRPPSIHQHSLIAMRVKVLPTTSVVSLNPLCCSPFRGDFDGDCFHGYVPQSLEARVELNELVSLDKQLINGQSGRNLLSLSQDSLTAAYLVSEERGNYLNKLQMQQFQMYCPYELPSPAIVKSARADSGSLWTGIQLFSMLLPPGFDYIFPSNRVKVSQGELLSSAEGSAWLRDGDGNIIESLIKYDKNAVINILYSAQEVLCEWLSMRGLSVSLLDLYLSPDPQSRRNMIEELLYGLQEAERTCKFKQLMVDSCLDLLAGISEEDSPDVVFDAEKLCYDRQRSAAVSQVSVDAFKHVFRDIQTLAYKYAGEDNSLLVMAKAGSKGNIMKLVQHSMCVGLQHSMVHLSFGLPHQLSCSAWNDQNSPFGKEEAAGYTGRFAKLFIPYGVIENSFLLGLNPLECFVHSVTSRDSSFSDNADLPGTLSRRLMFFMRDIYKSYDGTVRNAYGNQLVQLSYNTDDGEGPGGQPVGSLSACAISEAAYSALDQPISLLETSPLLNLKNVLECGSKKGLECGSKKGLREQTVSLYLSEKLGRHRFGFEYGALEVKNHLERLTFSEIVSTTMIIYSPQSNGNTFLSPWVCHFHILKEAAKSRRLQVDSIIDSLHKRYTSGRKDLKLDISDLQITNAECALDGEETKDKLCITVSAVEASKKSSLGFDATRDLLIPFLLGAVVKGFREIKKVEILWNDRPKVSKPNGNPSGELFLRVSMLGDGRSPSFWSALMNDCLQIMDLIDWTRSHPDNINQCCSAYGIAAGWKFFLSNLESAISDTGKSILPEHLLLVANCLSITGEFVGLNAKGWAKQRQLASVPSPFTQACFSSPSACFLKAAKDGVFDELQGTIDALAWGKVPSFGTGGQFDIVYSEKDHKFTKAVDVYDLLSSTATLPKTYVTRAPNPKSEKGGGQPLYMYGTAVPKALKTLDGKGVSKSYLKHIFTWNDIQKLSRVLRNILHKYPVNHRLNEADQRTLMMALYFHPNRDEKIGTGAQEIKVGLHPKHENARCFQLIRTDGTMEDFSYHKCVLGALEIIAPGKVNFYKSKWLQRNT